MSADLTPLLEQIRKAKRRLAYLAIAPIVMAPAVFLLPTPDSTVGHVVRLVFVAFLVGLGGLLLWEGVRSPESHPAIAALRTEGRVSWIYIEQPRNAQSGKMLEPQLRLGTVTGERLLLHVPEGRADEMLALVRACAPRAIVGWNPELELAFVTAPASLLQA